MGQPNIPPKNPMSDTIPHLRETFIHRFIYSCEKNAKRTTPASDSVFVFHRRVLRATESGKFWKHNTLTNCITNEEEARQSVIFNSWFVSRFPSNIPSHILQTEKSKQKEKKMKRSGQRNYGDLFEETKYALACVLFDGCCALRKFAFVANITQSISLFTLH